MQASGVGNDVVIAEKCLKILTDVTIFSPSTPSAEHIALESSSHARDDKSK